ncbi:MAG: transporter substrate-binding domain-containing protein [Rhodospirillales bacterium]|nr:transporter substrate-binding domain-containing protein [Rhodospirillales bacterium]
MRFRLGTRASIATLLLCFVSANDSSAAERVVRVGILHNPPIMVLADGSPPSGLAVDVIRNIAEKEGWSVSFVTDRWPNLLNKLYGRQIDILSGIAFSEKRAELYDFTSEALVSNWGLVYRRPETKIASILDLNGLRLAALPESIHTKVLSDLSSKFGVKYTQVPAKSYSDAMRLADAGDADVAVVNRLFGVLNADKYGLVESTINFNPVEVRFATPKGTGVDLRNAIDNYLSSQKQIPTSEYYTLISRWISGSKRYALPEWIIWVVGGALSALFIALLFIWALRRQVRKNIDKIAEGEATLARHIENTPIGAISWNKDFKCTDWNKAAERIFGYTHAEAVGRCPTEIILPVALHENIGEIYALLLAQGGGTQNTNENLTKSGKTITCEWFNTPIVNQNGEVTGVASLVQDISDRLHSEQKLLEAKEAAEKANKAKSEFLAVMSHDLRTPLNAIMGFSDMMRQKAFGPIGEARYEDYIEDIHSSGALLVSLINDVLDLSKIEAGKYELIEEPVSLPALIDVCTRQFRTQLGLSNLTLDVDIPPAFPPLKGDERALIQVLNNLLSNAIKFTSAGGMVLVSVGLTDENSVVIKVKDTGMGMTKDGIDKALRPFEHANSRYAREHQGTGLGLHLCKNLMNLFGGNLTIESKVGMGTSVTLSFPPDRTLNAA